MLRMLFAVGLLLFGAAQSLRGPFYGLLFYLGIAYFRPETWVWGDSLKGLNLSFAVGIYILLVTLVSSDRPRLTRPMAMIFILIAHALIATLLSPYSDWCFMWWKGFAKVGIIAVLIIGLVNTEERFRLTLMVITFALGFEGAKQGWAYIVLRPDGPNANELEILGDNNGVALGMLMLAAVIMSLLQTAKSNFQKTGFGFLLVGALFRSLTTYSRGGLLAFGAMCSMYWWRSRYRVRTALLVACLAVPLLMLLPANYWSRMQTINASADDRDASSGGRIHFWGVARAMAFDHPFFGFGTVGFQAAYDQYDTSGGQYGTGRAVHSTWFGILADQGYVGALIFVTILVAAFRACSRARRVAAALAGREHLIAYAGALQTSLVTVAVGGTFISYQYVEVLWHFVALCFALDGIVAKAATSLHTATVSSRGGELQLAS